VTPVQMAEIYVDLKGADAESDAIALAGIAWHLYGELATTQAAVSRVRAQLFGLVGGPARSSGPARKPRLGGHQPHRLRAGRPQPEAHLEAA
jgi:hypothetical protein